MTNEEAIERLRRVKELKVFGTSYMPAIDLAISALSRDRWISVEERLPEIREIEFEGEICTESEPVLVYGGKLGETYYNGMAVGERGDVEWVILDDAYRPDNHVTHWMPLPEPPKEDKP